MIENHSVIPVCSKPKSQRFNRWKRLWIVYGLVICVVVFGALLWSAATPRFREYRVHMLNGYTLLATVPIDWQRDKQEKSLFGSTYIPVSPIISANEDSLFFSRSKPTGIRKLFEDFVHRDAPNGSNKMITVHCICTPAVGAMGELNSKQKRDKDYIEFSQIFSMLGTTGPSNTTFSTDDSQAFGFWLIKESTYAFNPRRAGLFFQLDTTQSDTSIYASSPDKRFEINVHVSSCYLSRQDDLIRPALKMVVESIRVVPTVSHKGLAGGFVEGKQTQ